MTLNFPSPLNKLSHGVLLEHGIELWIKRDDLIHPTISGNKWRKLRLNIEKAKAAKHHTLLTFGGAFSNHIVATAAACKNEGLKSIGIIRGEEAHLNNPTLSLAQEMGMRILAISREDYRQKTDVNFIYDLRKKLGSFYLVPEGGANYYGAMGCMDLVKETDNEFDYICTACGTATTATGLLLGIQQHQKVLGFSALKGGEFLHHEVNRLLNYSLYEKDDVNTLLNQFELNTDFHFEGFGKTKPQLIDFVNWFYQKFDIPLDLIYTGKMMYGLFELIKSGYFKPGSKLVAVHTGGLQGNAGFKSKGVELLF